MNDFKILEEYVSGKVCVVLGTRPGIIKMAPIVKELKRRKINSFVIHAGQHYSYEMDQKFFEDLDLGDPKYKLEEVKNHSLHGEQTAEMLRGIERILVEERPETVLVCGDANFNLSGALAARKLGLKLGHVESGLRSNDWRMPEEHNRVMIDHISDYLFAPTEDARRNAIDDNVRGAVYVVGNTIVDAVLYAKDMAARKSIIITQLGLDSSEYFLLTAHREENVDMKECLRGIIDGMRFLDKEYGIPIIFPIHPRTKKMITKFGFEKEIESVSNLRCIDPLGYLDLVQLLSNTKCVFTDSGGLQEESCILGVRCVTLRESTERPETIEIGSNMLAGTDKDRIAVAAQIMLSKPIEWINPYGDGRTSKRIVDVITSKHS